MIRPPLYQEYIDWAYDALQALGFTMVGPWSMIRAMPWSTVIELPTDQGSFYLKSLAAAFTLEPKLLSYLNEHIKGPLPQMLAAHPSQKCFIMPNYGSPIRERFNNHFDAVYLAQGLSACAELQYQSVPHVGTLLGLGVPDWRLKNLPSLYEAFFEKQKDLLLWDGLTPDEISQLQAREKYYQKLCFNLARYGIPEALEHGDFHDNNILIAHDNLTISDWADARLTHPFFSCVSALNSAQKHHGFDRHHPAYVMCIEAYFKPWHSYAEQKHLQQALKEACLLYPFIFSLNFSGIYQCPGIIDLPSLRGYMASHLRKWLHYSAETSSS